MSGPLRTVLVDDGREMRRFLRVLLERDGRFAVVGEAADGVEAVDVVGEHKPDLVVLDIAMPRRDGISALPDVRAAAPGARVVMLSGFPRERMGDQATAAGAVGYLEKGYRTGDLAEELHRLAAVLEAVETLLAQSYPGDLTAPGSARRAVSQLLEPDVDADVVDTVLLLTSEVVTNAVKHGGTDCHVVVERLERTLRVSVADASEQVPAPRHVGDESESGRGLALVDMLAVAWGVEAVDHGKRVWFEVALEAS